MRNLLSLIFCLVLVSCGARQPKYTIGVSQCSQDSWRAKLNEELLSSTYLFDNVHLKMVSASDDDSVQIQQIREFIREKVDLLIISPNQTRTISPAIHEAYKAGIPVILFDRKSDTQEYTAFIGVDNREVGRIMAQFIAHELHGKGTVLEIEGLKGSSPAIERHEGFVEALREFPGIRLVDRLQGDWTEASGRKAMDAFLAAHPEVMASGIDFVFGQNDRMALGARTSLHARRNPHATRFVGIDALPTPDGGIVAVERQLLTASYTYPTRGDLVMQLAMNILEKKPFERENTLKAAIVTKDNATQLLLQHEEMMQQNERLARMHSKTDRYLAQYNLQKGFLLLLGVLLVLLIGTGLYVYRTILTKRRLSEEATNAKLQFFTNISHEFRTPLTLIIDPIDRLLGEKNLPAEQQQLLGVAKRNATVMLRLIGELLDFRKIQSGKMELSLRRFDLGFHLLMWAESFAGMAAKKSVTLHLPDGVPYEVFADREKVERIVYNLLANAIRHTPEGGNVGVALERGTATAAIRISDTGIGISPALQEKIFDDFFQASSKTEGGTGIGLTIVKAFAELHGGTVAVESEEGKGAAFTVTLPTRISEMPAVPVASEASSPLPEADAAKEEAASFDVVPEKPADSSPLDRLTAGDSEQRLTILLVDDNAEMRSYLASLLRSRYFLSHASNGVEALALVRKEKPDLILSDIMMPEMDGLEMCTRLKEDASTSAIPIILLTAQGYDEQRAQVYDHGADAYITKPFSSEVLLSRIYNLLENRRILKASYAEEEISPLADAHSDDAFMNAFREAVKEHLADPNFNVETLSLLLGMSRVQLYRKVKSLTGTTPVDLIRTTRLKRAERLLHSTSLTIAEISYQTGFSSPSYFTKCYKDYFGHLPAEER